jgi:Cupin-like domain
MAQKVFPEAAMDTLAAIYPAQTAKLAHTLLDHPLLQLDALVALATAIPRDSVEYNPGNLPVGIDPKDMPMSDLGIAETIRSIEENGSWMVIKRIEQHPAYAQLLRDTLAELNAIVEPRTGAMLGMEGFIFISSPGAVTPFHFDPEHNILLQVRGSKTMTVFSSQDETLVKPEAHELFHLGGHHRNHPWRDEFSDRGEAMFIVPGEAIYVPVKAPHWVKNGDAVSISLSITWRSDWSYAEADARAFNHVMRNVGIVPRSPAPYPARNLAKAYAYRAIRKVKSALGKGSQSA